MLANRLLGVSSSARPMFSPLATGLRCRAAVTPFAPVAAFSTRLLRSPFSFSRVVLASSSSPASSSPSSVAPHTSLVPYAPRGGITALSLYTHRQHQRQQSRNLNLRPASKFRSPEEIIKDPFTSIDKYFDIYQKDNTNSVDPSGRAFHYAAHGVKRGLMVTAARLAVMKIVYMMGASGDVVAGAKVEVDLKKIYEGTTLAIKWQGKPVFVRHRTKAEIQLAKDDDDALMKDPSPDEDRVKKPEWLVLIAICTHLGCVPLAGEGRWKGFFCPCHGSDYDTSGRIRLGPAPTNLAVPDHNFPSNDLLLVG